MKQLVYVAMRRMDRWTVKAFNPMPKPWGLGPRRGSSTDQAR